MVNKNMADKNMLIVLRPLKNCCRLVYRKNCLFFSVSHLARALISGLKKPTIHSNSWSSPDFKAIRHLTKKIWLFEKIYFFYNKSFPYGGFTVSEHCLCYI